MTYRPREREFDFDGSALVRQQDFETKASKINVVLASSGAFEVRSLEAQGGLVTLVAKDRNAEGTHLFYTPKDGRVAMSGAPVKLEDQGRRVQGKSMTFLTSGDQVEVVGDEGRTETVLQRKTKKP
jgi:lipopolysaccharide export system protein LptA